MKLLLLLEHTFVADKENNIWSEGVVDYNYLKRYLNVFEEVNVCARIKYNVEKDEYPNYKLLVNGEGVTFTALPYAISSKDLIKNYFNFRKIFKKAISESDKVMLRAPSLISIMLYDEAINKKKFGIEFVMGANSILAENNIFRKLFNKILDKKAKKMCLKANGVSYVTKENLQKKYPSYSIKYGDDENHFDSYYSSIDLHKEDYYLRDFENYNKPETFKLIHVGSMQNDRKGQKRLLDILKKLLDDKYKVKVTFLGDGKQKEDLMTYARSIKIEENVDFLGNIPDKKKVFEYLKNSDLFVLPSSSEGLPRSIIEAMANSLPCVASNVDGIPELIQKEYITDYDNILEFVKIIEKLLDNFDEMKKLGQKNYIESQKYSIEEITKRRNEFYSKLKEI